MKILLSLILCLFFIISAFCQITKNENFILRINAKNENLPDTLHAYLTCYIDRSGMQSVNIIVPKSGILTQVIQVEGCQNFSFPVGNTFVDFYVKSLDTVNISYDKKDINNTFKITGNNDQRTHELNFGYSFSKKLIGDEQKLLTKLSEENKNKNDSLKTSWINDQYIKECKFILQDTTTNKEFHDIQLKMRYFYWENNLHIRVFLNRMSEFLKYEISDSNNISIQNKTNYTPLYRKLNLSYFYTIPSYRDFLQLFTSSFYLGYNNPAIPFLSITDGKLYKDSINSNWLERSYYQALGCIDYYPIRDWYITYELNSAFEQINQYQTFEKVETVMMEFIPICRNPLYQDILLEKYNSMKKYKTGKTAPNFTLKDDKGKIVSLSDFKGKVIVLDFWGVHCSPCIQDIKNISPKVHTKYKNKNVVFINICVEDTEDNWKMTLKKYKMDGINLYAKGWTRNKVCQDYKIEAIPHYVLIDTEGNIADYNSAYYLYLSDNNILDKTLEQFK